MSDSRGKRRSNSGNKQHQRLSNGDSAIGGDKSKYNNRLSSGGRFKKMSDRDHRGDGKQERDPGPAGTRGKSYGKSKVGFMTV